jgi:protein-tyrosine-phosphatase
MSDGRDGNARCVLFLCTGNYYRSRFAETLFDHLARRAGLGWRAASRGVAIELGRENLGPISPWALAGLAARGILAPQPARRPRQARPADLAAAHRVVALKEAEHRRFLAERLPGWEDQVEYWHIHDLDVASPGEALARLEDRVRRLIDEIAAQADERSRR